MTKGRLFAAGFVILLLAIGVNTYIGLHVGHRLSKDEKQTCVIQNRGLKSQPHLTVAMAEIAKLLQPEPGQQIPPKYQPILAGLRFHLNAYVAMTEMQPKGRRC